MRLVAKVFAVIAAVIVVSITLNYVVLNNTVLPAFVELEQANAERNMQRIVDAIGGDLRRLRATAQDWAFWDSSHDFILDESAGYRADYIDANLVGETLEQLDLNVMLFLDSTGGVIWSTVLDLETGEEVQVEELAADPFPADSPLLDHTGPSGVVTGILHTGRAPMLTASAQILRSDRTGPPAGTLIIGRFLDESMVAALRDQTHVDFALHLPDEDGMTAAALETLTAPGTERQYWTSVEGDTTHAFGILRDIAGAPAMLMHAESPREIVAIGLKSTRFAMASLIVVGLAVMAVIGLMVQFVVLSPILALTQHALSIKRTGDLSQRLATRRKDEIGILSNEFDGMLAELSDARLELLDRSYKAGIAEMASGVLHNVRNQLNPLTMRLGSLRQRMSGPPDEKTDRAFVELSADENLSARSAKLLQYLKLSADRDCRERQGTLDDLDDLTRQLARVDDVLCDQDQFAHASRVIEPLRLSDVVARAVELAPGGEEDGIVISIDPDLAGIAPVRADRFILTHVLHGLLINSVEAIRAGGSDGGRIDVAASVLRPADGAPEIAVEIRDNGGGIAADAIDRIFERGFSTKRDGKGGFGLHWCANAIAALGGRIHAKSQGPNRGAEFHVVLPAAAGESKAAA